MITIIQGLWVLLIFLFLFKNLKYGVALYVAYLLLVPYMKINLGVSLQWNLVNLVLLIAFFKEYLSKYQKYRIDWTPLVPFVLYFGISLLMMPLQDGVPFADMLTNWRTTAMKTMILPFVVWNVARFDLHSVNVFRYTLLICILIASIYGLFLTTIPGINPYIELISEANEEEFIGGAWLLAEGEDRLFGRISSVFDHPMTFGLFLGLALIYIYNIRDHISKIVLYSLVILIILDVFFCGVRSVIAGVGSAVFYYMIRCGNVKTAIYISLSAFIGYYILLEIPGMDTYLGSISSGGFDDGTHGSSIDMRLRQFEGALEEIQNCALEGRGYGWTGFYRSTMGIHPTMLSFESLIIVVLCNSGFLGVLLWVYMVIKAFKYNSKNYLSESALLNSLLVFYIAFSCITGEYGYMQYVVLFYMLVLCECLYNKEIHNSKI